MVSKEKINEIRNKVDIVEIISDYIPLTKKGRNYFCVCPFHDDHSPSMSISSDKQIYTCFSCGASGNVFNFLMEYENISFNQALKILADKCGVVIDGLNIKKEISVNNIYYDIYNKINKLYINNINTASGSSAYNYLLERKLDDNLI